MNARQKNLVTLLATTVVACGLGFYAYFGVMKPEGTQNPQRPPEQENLLVAEQPQAGGPDAGVAPAPTFTWLSVKMPLASTVMERRDGTWRVTSPVSSLANKTQVDALIREISVAKFKSTLEQNPTDADLERYGLKPPQASVTARAYVPDAQGEGAEDPARQRSLTFHVGHINVFDDSVYVRREGDPAVYVAQGALRYALMQPTEAWRDRLVFPVEEPALLRIEVKARRNVLTLERATTDKPWQLVQPVKLRADGQRVAQMVSALRERKAVLFPDARSEEKVKQALDKPQVQATFVRKLGGPVSVRITELELNGVKQVFSLSTWDTESVLAQVDNATLDVLDVPSQEFKDKKVLAFDLRDVQQILIHPATGGELIKMSKAPDTSRWEVVAPLPGLAREFKLASLLGSLDKLQAVAIGEAHPKNWSRYGIGDTSRGVSLLDGAGQLVARLWVGTEVKGNPQRLWARGASEDVMELDKAAFDALPLTLEDFLDKPPVPGAPR